MTINQVRKWALNAEGIAKALSVVGEAGLTNKSLRAKRHRNYQKYIRNFTASPTANESLRDAFGIQMSNIFVFVILIRSIRIIRG